MNTNYDAIASKIRGYPDQVLDMYTKGTNPEVPPWLAMTILKERNNFERSADMANAAAQPQQPTVRDKLAQQTGIMANLGQAQAMGQQGMPQAPAAPQGYAQGGIIGFSEGDKVPKSRGISTAAEGENLLPTTTGYEGMGILEALQAMGSDASTAVRDWLASMERNARVQGAPRVTSVPENAPRMVSVPENPLTGMPEGMSVGQAARGMQGSPLSQGAPRVGAPGAGAPGVTGAPANVAREAADPFQALLMKTLTNAPKSDVPATMADYLKQQREGLAAQGITSLPFAGQRDRIAEIEARRAKEDAAREEQLKQRPLDELVNFLTSAKGGRASQALGTGAQAAQAMQAENRAQDVAYQKMRDEQSMKMLEIKSLNDRAELELAKGNVDGYQRLKAEAAKREQEWQQHVITGAASGFQTAEASRTRRQNAADAAAGRSDALKSKLESDQQNKALAMANAAATKAMSTPQGMIANKGKTIDELALEMYPKYLAALRGEQAPGPSTSGGKVVDWNSIR